MMRACQLFSTVWRTLPLLVLAVSAFATTILAGGSDVLYPPGRECVGLM
jgi:hypothetical protein